MDGKLEQSHPFVELAFTLSRRHALELLHPFARRSLAVGKTRHVFGNDRAQTPAVDPLRL